MLVLVPVLITLLAVKLIIMYLLIGLVNDLDFRDRTGVLFRAVCGTNHARHYYN